MFLAPGLCRLARAQGPCRTRPITGRLGRRRHLIHADHAIGAIALAIAAADAGLVDEHLAVRTAADRIGRAIGHAMRMLAVAARGRHVQVGIGAPSLAVEPGQAVVAVGAGLFAVVAADAQVLVDQQHVGGFADAVVDEELRGLRNTCRPRRRSCPCGSR